MVRCDEITPPGLYFLLLSFFSFSHFAALLVVYWLTVYTGKRHRTQARYSRWRTEWLDPALEQIIREPRDIRRLPIRKARRSRRPEYPTGRPESRLSRLWNGSACLVSRAYANISLPVVIEVCPAANSFNSVHEPWGVGVCCQYFLFFSSCVFNPNRPSPIG